MNALAGQVPAAPGIPLPTSKTRTTAESWTDADVAAATFHLRANGATETVVGHLLVGLAAQGVRRLRAYVEKFTEEDVERAGQACELATAVAGPSSRRRGDLIRVQQRVRWAWRVTSGGAHYAS
jgi:hypothetical protein